MRKEFLEGALECVQNNKYGAAAEQLSKIEEPKLQAECERLSELLSNHSELLGGAIGAVVGNYEDRLIDELAKKISEEGEN